MLALVVDYDRNDMDFEESVEQVTSFGALPFRPNYACSTLSGGVRLVWVMEQGLNMNTIQSKKFQMAMKKEFHLNKLLPGLDDGAIKDPTKYYEVGENWKQLSSEPIPSEYAFMWMQKSFGTISICERLEDEVPLDRVQSELEKQFPDVKFPKLELGMRMHRFWDPSAQNESSAFLLPGGFFCHTGDEGFMGWTRLLGMQFMREFEVEKTGVVVDKFWYDGGKYISRNPVVDDNWMIQGQSDATLNIAGTYGLSKAAPKKGELTPIERILHQIQMRKTVTSFAKFVHRPEGEIMFQGEKHINTCKVRALQPSGESGKWGEHFPWLAQFVGNLFVSEHQMYIFLAWWKRFYSGALEQVPNRGQIMIIAGPPACGKTLLNTKMLAPSVGGGIDAADYYVNGVDFGGSYFEYGLHMVDDGEPGRRVDTQKAMAARYKKTAASSIFTINQKYEKVKTIEWCGRVCTTANSDPESLKTMPELQQTLEDKIIILRADEPSGLLEETESIEDNIKEELPHLLQWLLDWDPPKEVVGGKRYGVISFCDVKLKGDMEAGSADMVFLELLDTFLTEVQASGEHGDGFLEIRTTDLVERMSECELIKTTMRQYKAVHIGHIMSRFHDKGYDFAYKRKTAGSFWKIGFDYLPKEEENG